MSKSAADVIAAVHERAAPSADERTRFERAIDRLLDRTTEVVDELSVDAEAMVVGSAARDTWISGDRDIDIFVQFNSTVSRSELAEYGLNIGHTVLGNGREEYAEHPYVTGEFDGFMVDLVPCYAIDSTEEIATAVDRTPFHTEYLEARLTAELVTEIRVFKQFLKGIGVYGSNLRTRGFSGYLTELLVLEYGGAEATIDAAADWDLPITLDPESHGIASFEDPFVLIDPTDPTRNVAAVLAVENIAKLQHYAREFQADPREELFFPVAPTPLTPAEVREHIAKRGTTPIAIVFDAPDVVQDDLFPQLTKSMNGISDDLERRGFRILRRDIFLDEHVVLLFELSVAEQPDVERHDGPPVHVRAHAIEFYEKYAEADVFGPFISEDRYVVEREREFTDAASVLDSDAVFDVRLGPSVRNAMEDGYDVLVGDEISVLADEIGAGLAVYFDPRP